MAVQLPNGMQIFLATVYGTAKLVSAVTNADPAVATTAAAHLLVPGAIVEVTSGWSPLNQKIVRLSAAAAESMTYEGIDSTNVLQFPVGGGVGSVRDITTFTQVSQVLTLTSSGGDMQFATYTFLESDADNQLPSTSSAQSLTIEIADDSSLPGYQALKAAASTRELTALKMQLRNGDIILYNGYVSFNETPTITKGSVMSVKATFSLAAQPVRYSAA